MLAILLVLSTGAHAQVNDSQTTPRTFTLGQALQYAVDHYPTVRAALEHVNASTANVSVAKAAYLPRLDSFWQIIRATANNIFGQLLPQSPEPGYQRVVLQALALLPAQPPSDGRSIAGAVRGSI